MGEAVFRDTSAPQPTGRTPLRRFSVVLGGRSISAPARSVWRSALAHGFAFVWDCLTVGPACAHMRAQIGSAQPLDAETVWNFWTGTRNPLSEFLRCRYPPQAVRKWILARRLLAPRADGIRAHYDLPVEFYRLFLDTQLMLYSCARFVSPLTTLEQAQRNKADFIATLLTISSADHVLDLGCGWGGMMRFLLNQGVKRTQMYGYTLSQEQHRYTRTTGLQTELADFVAVDIPPQSYDKIYSIGSLEHVRPDELRRLHRKLFRALRPEGRIVHQFFSLERARVPASMLLAQEFFPGSLLSSHAEHLAAMREAGFKVVLDFTDDYRPTLRAWFDRLVSHKEAALTLAGTGVYNKYLCFFPAAWRFFDDGEAALHRVVLTK